jgi:hypothetical protein
MPSRCCHDPALSAELTAGERPLTLPVAPRGFRTSRNTSRNQDRFRHPSVKKSDFPDPERLPSMSAPRSAGLDEEERLSDLREPATGLVVLPPAIRLPTLLHSPFALAWVS